MNQWTVFFITLNIFSNSVSVATIVELTADNVDRHLSTPRLSFVNFYVDWCPHSRNLAPIIEEVADKLKTDYPRDEQLIVARVDSQAEESLTKKYGVMKYPTMKLFRYGQPQRLEYRGQRSVNAISDFIRSQLTDPLVRLEAPLDNDKLPLKPQQLAMIGQFADNSSAALQMFLRVADVMRDEECIFLAIVGPKVDQENIVFQKGTDTSTKRKLDYISETSLKKLAQESCVPIVRELTFENAESISEEGLPLFILFYRDDGKEIIEKYKRVVDTNLKHFVDRINFVYGSGALFVRPLRHLRKTLDNLPLIAIDSYQHMYAFEFDVMETLQDFPSRLANFIEDLFSGRLHTEFHRVNDGDKAQATMATEPPPSAFKRLSPSASRYSFAREEL